MPTFRTRLPKLSDLTHARLAEELYMTWPPAYRALKQPDRTERHRAEAQQFKQTGESI